jgi:hypothetical protein
MNFGPLEFAAYLRDGGRASQDAPEPVCVYEMITTRAGNGVTAGARVRVRLGTRPLVLVLSSHHAVDWQLELQRGTRLEAVLLAGAGESTVRGAGEAQVTSIGGFYAFRRGSLEFQHLEDEVRRCTRRGIQDFQSLSADSLFEIDAR